MLHSIILRISLRICAIVVMTCLRLSSCFGNEVVQPQETPGSIAGKQGSHVDQSKTNSGERIAAPFSSKHFLEIDLHFPEGLGVEHDSAMNIVGRVVEFDLSLSRQCLILFATEEASLHRGKLPIDIATAVARTPTVQTIESAMKAGTEKLKQKWPNATPRVRMVSLSAVVYILLGSNEKEEDDIGNDSHSFGDADIRSLVEEIRSRNPREAKKLCGRIWNYNGIQWQ